jgi:hypothetical protein
MSSLRRKSLLAVMIQTNPTQASHPILPNVRILANEKPRTAATATKTAVQAACEETELRPMEMPSIAEPATKIQSRNSVSERAEEKEVVAYKA